MKVLVICWLCLVWLGACSSAVSPSPTLVSIKVTPQGTLVAVTGRVETATVTPTATETPRPRRNRVTATTEPTKPYVPGVAFPDEGRTLEPLPNDLTNRIAYLEHHGLWIAKPDGTDRNLIFRGDDLYSENIGRVVWSPDGTQVALFAGPSLVVSDLRNSKWQMVYLAKGLTEKRQRRLDYRSPGVGWEPNNKAIAFVDDGRLWVAWLETKQMVLLAEGAGYYPEQQVYYDGLTWTPDGKWILYRQWGDGDAYSDLVAISPRDGTKKIIVPSVLDFALARDGQALAFSVDRSEVHIADAECLNDDVPSCLMSSKTFTLSKPVSRDGMNEGVYGGLYWTADNVMLSVGKVLLNTLTGEMETFDTKVVFTGSNPISPSGKELIGIIPTDGGMTDAILLIYDTATGTERPFIEFDEFASWREAVWSPR